MEDSALRELALRAAAADMEAAEELIRGLHSSLFGFLYLLGVSRKDVEELAQETVVQMYRSLGRYRADQPFLPWLRSIAGHVVANHRRSHVRQKEAFGEFHRYVEELSKKSVAKFDDVRQNRLRDCIGRLQEKHREMVALRYFKGLDSGQVAEQLNLNPAAVRQSLSRIRGVLRACVESALGVETV